MKASKIERHEMPGFSALISVSLNSVVLQFVSVLSSRLLNNVGTFLYLFHIKLHMPDCPE